MLTPQEVSQHAFSKASFGGYQMAQVDEFLDVLTADYTALYKENAVLKNKMKVLVDKVEEYRATEDAMRMTLLSAQKMASALVAEAEEQKAAVLRGAEGEINERVTALRREVEVEEYRLAAAKSSTAGYVQKLRELFERERAYLETLSELAPPPPAEPDPLEDTVSEIDSSIQRLMEEEPIPAQAEDLADTREMDPGALHAARVQEDGPTRRLSVEIIEDDLTGAPSGDAAIDFENLQFGKEFQL